MLSLDQMKQALQAAAKFLADLANGVYHDPYQPPATLPMNASKITLWAVAIDHAEGDGLTHPNRINSNPWNLKYTGYTESLGATPGLKASDGSMFCKFENYHAGLQAITQFLTDACNDRLKAYRSTMTLDEFTTVYAQPPNKNYVDAVAKELNVSPSTPISAFL